MNRKKPQFVPYAERVRAITLALKLSPWSTNEEICSLTGHRTSRTRELLTALAGVGVVKFQNTRPRRYALAVESEEPVPVRADSNEMDKGVASIKVDSITINDNELMPSSTEDAVSAYNRSCRFLGLEPDFEGALKLHIKHMMYEL